MTIIDKFINRTTIKSLYKMTEENKRKDNQNPNPELEPRVRIFNKYQKRLRNIVLIPALLGISFGLGYSQYHTTKKSPYTIFSGDLTSINKTIQALENKIGNPSDFVLYNKDAELKEQYALACEQEIERSDYLKNALNRAEEIKTNLENSEEGILHNQFIQKQKKAPLTGLAIQFLSLIYFASAMRLITTKKNKELNELEKRVGSN